VADELKIYERKIAVRSAVAAIAILPVAALLAGRGHIDVPAGLAFGFAASFLKLHLQVKNLVRFGALAAEEGKKAVGYRVSSGFAGIAVIAAVLLIAAVNRNALNVMAAGAGLFLTNAVIVISEAADAVRARGRS